MTYKVPFIRPSFPSADEVAEDYKQIVASNWFTNFGPFERKFAQEIGNYIGDEYTAVTFCSATAGLLASIVAILGKGDNSKYVIMPSFTFAAGADAIIWCGYKPLFVDIEQRGLHMDIDATKTAIEQYGDEIAGILFCNAFGAGTYNIEEWEALAKSFNLPLIIDSAAGFGSLYSNGSKVGRAGDCEIFSFHATKSFAIGEGGAVVTKNKQLAEQLVSIQNFGFNKRNATYLGFNGKLQEISAAIGLRQMDVFEDSLKNKRTIFDKYSKGIDSSRYSLQLNAQNAALCFAVIVMQDSKQRDQKLNELHEAGVDAKTYYSPALHSQNYFKDCTIAGSLHTTEKIEASVLSLPLHYNMSDEHSDLIINVLNNS